jgi:hypothetical protein
MFSRQSKGSSEQIIELSPTLSSIPLAVSSTTSLITALPILSLLRLLTKYIACKIKCETLEVKPDRCINNC